MVGLERLNNVQACLERVITDNVPGDFIETGVWRGGASIFARAVLLALGSRRSVYVADSFCGFPPPREGDDGDPHHTINYPYLSVSLTDVQSAFERYGLLDGQVKFVQGYFHETLPSLSGLWSVIRADADSYSSTMTILNSLYPALSIGGYVILDDYVPGDVAPNGCRRAVDDFRAARGITEPLQQIDWAGMFWRRER